MNKLAWLGVAVVGLGATLGVANISGRPIPGGVAADQVLIEKAPHQLTLLRGGIRLKTYHVALGRQPVGDKVRQGDNRTPEGVFAIDQRNARSTFHRALHVSYPDAAHSARAKELGVDPGGDIMISWDQERIGLARQPTSSCRLDGRSRGAHKSRDRGGLACGSRRNARGDPALSEGCRPTQRCSGLASALRAAARR